MISPGLDPNCLCLIELLKEFFEMLTLKKVSRRQQKHNYLVEIQENYFLLTQS